MKKEILIVSTIILIFSSSSQSNSNADDKPANFPTADAIKPASTISGDGIVGEWKFVLQADDVNRNKQLDED